ncbi:unnamed protein product [Orchesella dallaii]|uniref:SIAH-type domain-containing protein n=1 Tax=Orchesella dallaii TaxID=48710 RepID=A0ABP1QA81_9HEXA
MDLSSSSAKKDACAQLLIGLDANSERINAIYRKFECSFCETTLGLECFTCSGDSPHLFCEECAGQVSECPFCMTPISTSSLDDIKRCLNSLRNIPCKYKTEGCQAILEGDELIYHLTQCNFRPIKCFMPKCGQNIPFKQFFHHLTSDHASRVNGIYNNNCREIEWWINGDLTSSGRDYKVFFRFFLENVMYLSP